ncbi:hypothetical protein [Caulobacter sp. BK020]|uniref:hypothetical protein n=1 Tax=Caulobacter sp. BK020 TaxID=2512117 RepID=UPI0010D12F8C|nr:hypothetical protein [Caulobacter sp. BK020]TCS10293.1 hypothetical protein EV278_11830 [Caulobacter sp. BK020]
MAKIHGVLPLSLRRSLDDATFYIGRDAYAETGVDLARVRLALREQRKMRLPA